MTRNIFVLGLDEANLETLEHIADAEDYRFHQLLSVAELQGEDIDLPKLLDKASAILESFDGRIDAVIGYWDFPISSMIPLLSARFGLRSADLQAVVKCEHKYWSRLEQSAAIEEYPRFALVDPEHDRHPPDGLRYPLWLKPVKSFSSELAFKARDDDEYAWAVGEIAEGAGRLGEPFGDVLAHVELPPEVAEAGGTAILAEEALSGTQLTVEGYNVDGEVHIYGIVDSVPYPGTSSFLRYQYPSTLPSNMVLKACEVAGKVIKQIGLDSVPFNIEFFADPVEGEIAILEINPRHSQSHARLFEAVDGTPNHQCMVRLALGLDPDLPFREGPYQCAAKWFLRRFEDGIVRRVPTADEIARVEKQVPGSVIQTLVPEGERLSDLDGQDSYSFELADIFVGADSERELAEKYDRCVAELPFEFDPVEEDR